MIIARTFTIKSKLPISSANSPYQMKCPWIAIIVVLSALGPLLFFLFLALKSPKDWYSTPPCLNPNNAWHNLLHFTLSIPLLNRNYYRRHHPVKLFMGSPINSPCIYNRTEAGSRLLLGTRSGNETKLVFLSCHHHPSPISSLFFTMRVCLLSYLSYVNVRGRKTWKGSKSTRWLSNSTLKCTSQANH